MKLKKGNQETLEFYVVDEDGDAITTLSTATDITFIMKSSLSGDALFTKTLTDGITADVDKNGSAKTGSIRVILDVDDTNLLAAGDNYPALQVTWTGDNVQEVDITYNDAVIDKIFVKDDLI